MNELEVATTALHVAAPVGKPCPCPTCPATGDCPCSFDTFEVASAEHIYCKHHEIELTGGELCR